MQKHKNQTVIQAMMKRAHRPLKALGASLLLTMLVACGGGGGSSPAEVPNGNNQAPANVKLLEVSSASVGQITASWLPATDDATPASNLTYQLHASTDAAFTPSSATKIFEGKDIYQTTVSTGVTPGSKYTLKLVVLDGQSAATSSEGLSVTVSNANASLNTGVKVTTLEPSQVASINGNQVTVQAGAAGLQVGQFIASAEGASGNGYLKKIESVTSSNGNTVLTTRDASVNEVVKEVNLSSAFKIASVPKEITAASTQAGLVRRTASNSNPNNEYVWSQSGFRYTAPSSTTPAQTGLPGNWGLQAGLTQGAAIDKTGSWSRLYMPGSVTVAEGETADFNIHTYIVDTSEPLIGQRRKICKIDFGAMKGVGDLAKPSAVSISAGGGTVNNQDAYRPTHIFYPTTLKAGAATASPNPYTVDVTLYIEELDQDCNSQTFWDEKVTLPLSIYVTNDGAALREKESLTGTFKGSGDFKVTNDIEMNFHPTITFDAVVADAKLSTARIQLDAAPLVEQTLKITASAQSTVNADYNILPVRKFYKVYVTAAGVPIVISGEYRVDMNIKGDVSGAIDAIEKLKIGFDELSYGLEYKNGQYNVISKRQPVYRLSVGGNGKAQANLEITLQPRLQLSAYEAATGTVLLEPYMNAHAGIEGHVQLDTEVDFNQQQLNMAADADYRLTKGTLGGGVRAKLGAELKVWDISIAAWPAKGELQSYDLVEQTDFWGLPQITAAANTQTKHSTDSRVMAIQATATTVHNPLKNLFASLPETFVTWSKWTDPRIVPQLGVTSDSYRLLPTTSDGLTWAVFTQPGTYTVRQGGYSSLGTWARQYTETTIEIKDVNVNGIPDWWEQRYGLTGSGAAIAAADADGDGLTNLEEWELGGDPTVKAGAVVITSVTPATLTEGQKTIFTINGANLTADIEVKPTFGSCHTPYAVTSTQIKVVCAVVSSSSGAATVMEVRKTGGSTALYKRTLTLSGNLDCAFDQIDQGGVCVTYGQMSRDIEAPTVMQEVVFRINQWWEGVKSVLWTFSDRTTILAKEVIETLSTSFATQGETTVTAIYKDANDNVLGSKSVKVQVGPAKATVTTTTSITNVQDSQGASIASGSTTTETKPKLSGTLSANLTTGQVLRVLDNSGSSSEQIYQATVSGTSWALQIATALASGSHSFTAQVFDGVNIIGGTPSAAWPITVNAGTTTASKLPHSGVTNQQCYFAGSNTLMACSGVANDLNAQQDGHRASINAMSYSTVGSYSKEECVKDNVTGLIWEGKTASGTRAGGNTYTNFDSSATGNGQNDGTDATAAQVTASTNSMGYVAAVNAMALCGYTDWRLPTVDELQTIVDYSKPYPGPTINTTWFPRFPNTLSSFPYWSSSPYLGYSGYAWVVDFTDGVVVNGYRDLRVHVRLVRSSQ